MFEIRNVSDANITHGVIDKIIVEYGKIANVTIQIQQGKLYEDGQFCTLGVDSKCFKDNDFEEFISLSFTDLTFVEKFWNDKVNAKSDVCIESELASEKLL